MEIFFSPINVLRILELLIILLECEFLARQRRNRRLKTTNCAGRRLSRVPKERSRGNGERERKAIRIFRRNKANKGWRGRGHRLQIEITRTRRYIIPHQAYIAYDHHTPRIYTPSKLRLKGLRAHLCSANRGLCPLVSPPLAPRFTRRFYGFSRGRREGIEINRSTGINANNETGDWGNYASMNSFYFNLLLA